MCKRAELLVDDLEVVEHLLELALADLEEHLLLFVQVHLHIKHRLLHALLVFARYLDVQPPVEVPQFLQTAAELILEVLFGGGRVLAQQFDQIGLELLFEGGGELGGDDVLVEHGAAADVLLHEVVQRRYEHQRLVIGDAQSGRQHAQSSGQVLALEAVDLGVERL